MGYLVAGGYFLIGCGPVLVWFFSRVAISPFLVVLTFTSCATWTLCAIVLAAPLSRLLPLGSSVEYVLPLLLSGISHEFCRKVSWALQAGWTNDALEAMTRHFGYKRIRNSDRVSMHIAWGLGQGIARCIFFFASNALLAFGPGTLYSSACPTLPYFFTTALSSLAFVSIHTSVMLIDFQDILDEPHTPSASLLASAATLFACLLTLGSLAKHGCLFVLPSLVTLATVLLWRATSQFIQLNQTY